MYYNPFNPGLNNFWVLRIEFAHMHFKNAVSSIFEYGGFSRSKIPTFVIRFEDFC